LIKNDFNGAMPKAIISIQAACVSNLKHLFSNNSSRSFVEKSAYVMKAMEFFRYWHLYRTRYNELTGNGITLCPLQEAATLDTRLNTESSCWHGCAAQNARKSW